MSDHPWWQPFEAEPMDQIDMRIKRLSHLDIETLSSCGEPQGREQRAFQAHSVLSDRVQDIFWDSCYWLAIFVQATKVVKPADNMNSYAVCLMTRWPWHCNKLWHKTNWQDISKHRSGKMTLPLHLSHWIGAPKASTILVTAPVTSGPMPSPGMRVTVCLRASPGLGT